MPSTAGITYAPVGRCIYCGNRECKLGKEHIVPLSLGGNLVLPEASCNVCAGITKQFEQTCARTIFGALRIRLGLPTRNPGQRPDNIATVINRGRGRFDPLELPAAEFPAVCFGALLPSPGILTGDAATNVVNMRPIMKSYADDVPRIVEQYSGIRIQRMHWESFFALLSKIAHSYAVSQIGVDAFTHLLPDLILGRSDKWPYLIGGDSDPMDEPLSLGKPPYKLHELVLRKANEMNLLFVTIRLFRFLGMPRYHVVVGHDLRD